VDQAVFFGMNAGLVLFIASLLGDWTWPCASPRPSWAQQSSPACGVFSLRLAGSEAREELPIATAEPAAT
jgi:hypothetical protein